VKLNGEKIGKNVELVVFTRGERTIVLEAHAIDDLDIFDKLVVMPKPPKKITPSKLEIYDHNNPTYLAQLTRFSLLRVGYMVFRSLRGIDGEVLEWEYVDESKPDTWADWLKDLEDFGLSKAECVRVQNAVLKANALSESHIEKARQDFVLGRAERSARISGQPTEPENTPSGNPVSV